MSETRYTNHVIQLQNFFIVNTNVVAKADVGGVEKVNLNWEWAIAKLLCHNDIYHESNYHNNR